MSGHTPTKIEDTNEVRLPGYQFQDAATRRSFLSASAKGAAVAAFAGGASGIAQAKDFSTVHPSAFGEDGHIRYDYLDFDTAEEAMRARVRLEFGWADATYVWWYTFVLFGVTQDRSPVRLLRMEGMEMSEWRQPGAHEFIVHGHNFSVPTDDTTGAYLSSWTNPLTGETVPTEPTTLTSDPGRRKTPLGNYDLASEGTGLRPDQAIMRIEGDLVLKDDVRLPPASWPGQFAETNGVSGSVAELMHSDTPSLQARGSGMWIQPYLKWMKMPAGIGHMVGYFHGRKLPSVEALPKPFYEKLTKEYPDLARVDPTKFTGEYWEKNEAGLLNVD